MKTVLSAMIVAGLLAGPAAAQTHVYKCVDGPHPVYQQTPCQGRAEWRWDVPAEQSRSRSGTEATAKGAGRGVRSARPAARSVRGSRGRAQGALISLARDPAGCEQARREQARVMTRTRRLDYQQRRQLEDALRLACQPP